MAAFEVLRLAAQHDAFGRVEEAQFMYRLATELLEDMARGESAPLSVVEQN